MNDIENKTIGFSTEKILKDVVRSAKTTYSDETFCSRARKTVLVKREKFKILVLCYAGGGEGSLPVSPSSSTRECDTFRPNAKRESVRLDFNDRTVGGGDRISRINIVRVRFRSC